MVKAEILEKVARLHILGVADKELAGIAGIDENALKDLFATDEFMGILTKVNEEQFTHMEMVNRGWDGVEEVAVAKVLSHLQSGFADQDYALRAAVLSNKAERRGKSNLPTNQNHPLVIPGSIQSVLQLHMTYIQKLQIGLTVHERGDLQLAHKEVNFLSPQKAKELLRVEKKSDFEEDAKQVVMNLQSLFEPG